MATVPSRSPGVVVVPIDAATSVESAIVSFSSRRGTAILESSDQTTGYGRFSVLACDPIETIHIEPGGVACPFQQLFDRIARYPRVSRPAADLPFAGGWIGMITYEAGLMLEGLARRTPPQPGLPLLRFGLYDAAAVFDHRERRWYLVAVDWPSPWKSRRPPVAERLAVLRKYLESPSGGVAASPRSYPHPIPNMSREQYLAKVRRAKRYIEAGDVYQVNLTQRFTTESCETPLDLYLRLRRSNPSSHAAFLRWDDTAILCSSPELFLELREDRVVTRPIKGTRPRIDDPLLDEVYRRELQSSAKDRAELTMIIDLLRNDLGRVCSFGSVRVKDAGVIEQHPTVFHRVATIEGRLAPGRNRLDLLRATFPGGSITGAPKIRAMQIIDELEPTARGVYCGSIGMIGLDGSLSLNIAIRTMLQVGDTVHLYAGGAIVADSDPEEEYREVLAKASGMLRALECETRIDTPSRARSAIA